MTEPHPHRFPGVTFAAIGAELARELTARMNLYRDRVAKGRMTEGEAQHQLAMVEALAADVARFARLHSATRGEGPQHTFTWRQRLAALDRELALRRRHYPEWIAGGRLDQATADRRLACLDALRWLYLDGADWTPANGTWPAGDTPAARDSRAQWQADFAAACPDHPLALDHRRQQGEPTEQQEMFA